MSRWPQFRLPDGTLALYQADAAIVPAGAGHPGDAGPGPPARRRAARAAPRCSASRPRRRRHRGRRPRRACCAAAGSWSAPTPGSTTCSASLGHAHPARGDARAGHLLRADRPGDVRAGPAAAVDLDGRPVVLRLPVATASRPSRPPRTAAARWSTRTTRARSPTRRCRRCSPSTCARMLPGSGDAGAVAALPVHADPRPRLRDLAGARPRVGGRRAGCGARLQVRADVRPAARRPRRSTGRTTTDLSAFRLDRPALTDPDYQAHWLV